MADEIQFSYSGYCRNGYFRDEIPAQTEKVTQTTLGGGGPGIATIGTSEEDITFTDVATNGKLFMQNLDTVNFVKYGPKSAGAMVEMGRMKPGEIVWTRMAPGVTLRMIADTSACKVMIKLYND
jgi:hypothetical protein